MIDVIEGGSLWRHYKGKPYLVLGTFPTELHGPFYEDQKVEVYHALRHAPHAWFSTSTQCPSWGCPRFAVARYTGEEREIAKDELLVLYVGLYDNPRGNTACLRPLSEWEEKIDARGWPHYKGEPAPRYVRTKPEGRQA